MISTLRLSPALAPGLRLLGLFTLLLGLLYPLLVYGLANALWPWQAQGSLWLRHGQPVGSALIGQPFAGPQWFHGRPSAISVEPGQTPVSTGSNLGPSQPQLLTQARERLLTWRTSEQQTGPAPQDMLTASASGLDPHISLAAALAQVARVAQARGLDAAQLAAQVRAQAAHPWFSDGQAALARVNVLQLNLLLETP